jgi:RimJ/RimL family protein N-acetyltransferase/ubiquinone/menaquinone biosynthesis C-methylase UbiE
MLIGNKIVLEEIDHSNIEQMRQWRNDPSMRRFFREYKDISKDKQELWYKERGNNTNAEHVYFQIMALPEVSPDMNPGCADVGERTLIGACGLHYINWRTRSAEFGIFLGAKRGGGRGKEALLLMCDYGFKELNLHKIWCEVYDNNDSIGLYRHIGFKDEGVLRDNYYHDGKYGNSNILSVIEDEWREKYGDDVLCRTKNISAGGILQMEKPIVVAQKLDDSKNREEFWKNIKGYHETNTSHGEEQRIFLAKMLLENNVESVLELGCNSGGNLLHISKVLPNIKLVGLDICENAIKYGVEVEKNPAQMIVGSIYDLDRFEDNSFDVVFTRGVMMHVNHEKIRGVLKNMARIAKRYVINIETDGEDKILSYGDDGTPHAFSHDFSKVYKSFGITVSIAKMSNLTHTFSKGGATHFIWAGIVK